MHGKQAFGVGRHRTACVGQASGGELAAHSTVQGVLAVAEAGDSTNLAEVIEQGTVDGGENDSLLQRDTNDGAFGQAARLRAVSVDEHVATEFLPFVPRVGYGDKREAVGFDHCQERGVIEADSVGVDSCRLASLSAGGQRQGQCGHDEWGRVHGRRLSGWRGYPWRVRRW